jgi:hypothetical protein
MRALDRLIGLRLHNRPACAKLTRFKAPALQRSLRIVWHYKSGDPVKIMEKHHVGSVMIRAY